MITAAGVAAVVNEDCTDKPVTRRRCEWICRGFFPGTLRHVQAAMAEIAEDTVRLLSVHVILQANTQHSHVLTG